MAENGAIGARDEHAHCGGIDSKILGTGYGFTVHLKVWEGNIFAGDQPHLPGPAEKDSG